MNMGTREGDAVYSFDTTGPIPKSSPHVSSELFSAPHTACTISSPSSTSADALSLFSCLLYLLFFPLLFRVTSSRTFPGPGSHHRPLSTSARGLTIGRVLFALHLPRTWEIAACMASSTKPRTAHSVSPALSRSSIRTLGEGGGGE